MTVGKVRNRSRSCQEMTGLIHFLCFHLYLQGKNLRASCSRAGLSKFRSPHRPVKLCYVSSFHSIYLSYSLLPTYQAHRKFSKYLNESVCQLKLIIFSSKGGNPESETSALRYSFTKHPAVWGG